VLYIADYLKIQNSSRISYQKKLRESADGEQATPQFPFCMKCRTVGLCIVIIVGQLSW
jgi:hypothetical protein